MVRNIASIVSIAMLIACSGDPLAIGKDPDSSDKGGQPQATKGKKEDVQSTPRKTLKTSKGDRDSTQSESDDDNSHSAEEDAIRKTALEFIKAYADADAEAIGQLFTEDAEFVDEQGNVSQGRKQIENIMSASFADHPGSEIEISITSLRFPTASMAIEDGATRVKRDKESEPLYGAYTAIHVKEEGKWRTASVREHAPKDRRQHRAMLQQLSWLRGAWVDESDQAMVQFQCESAGGGNFLDRSFIVQTPGHFAISGTQRIGWDPLAGKLRAWIFDSEGGYGEGYWHKDQDRWVLKATGVTAAGESTSSTTIYTRINENTMTWQSVDHEIGGVEIPDSEVVTIIRRVDLSQAVPNSTPSSK